MPRCVPEVFGDRSGHQAAATDGLQKLHSVGQPLKSRSPTAA